MHRSDGDFAVTAGVSYAGGKNTAVQPHKPSWRYYGDPRHDLFLKYCCSNTGVTFTGAEYVASYPCLAPEEAAFIRRAGHRGRSLS